MKIITVCHKLPWSWFTFIFTGHLISNINTKQKRNESTGKTNVVLYMTNKGRLMDAMEKFYMYKEARNNNQINYKDTVKLNMIFDVIVRENTARAHTSS